MTVAERVARVRAALTAREWLTVSGIAAVVILLHVTGWGVLIGVIAPQHLTIAASGVFGVGLGVTAYTLGMRHAFDADHIAAIDNTTRKLMHEGTKPLAVGFWFSLGHSTIVFALCALLAAGVRAITSQLEADSSVMREVLGVVGTSISGVFLWLIGILNLVILIGIVRIFRRMRQGELDEIALEEQLHQRGVAGRVLRRFGVVIRRPWQMYLVGLLFGLGFDTATEVSLLMLAGGAAAVALPWYAILTLPILFAAGMSLLDSLDGIFMTLAYGWAFTKPLRKVYYNLVITALSVAVALVIGTIELASVISDRAGITSGPIAAIGSIDLGGVGFVVIGLFVVAWIVAVLAWHWGDVERRWSSRLTRTPTPPA